MIDALAITQQIIQPQLIPLKPMNDAGESEIALKAQGDAPCEVRLVVVQFLRADGFGAEAAHLIAQLLDCDVHIIGRDTGGDVPCPLNLPAFQPAIDLIG